VVEGAAAELDGATAVRVMLADAVGVPGDVSVPTLAFIESSVGRRNPQTTPTIANGSTPTMTITRTV